ncbi:hypothetical protein CDL15_Pgr004868 [Punica granatum]|uniref:Uncharacterized protein n=1 Tax=Punica granatum TaxID=22663 RepID=A0A218W6Y0_PUNGR|nr:hypothetical protein CDL15_Pgr004868 [Punica granatum]
MCLQWSQTYNSQSLTVVARSTSPQSLTDFLALTELPPSLVPDPLNSGRVSPWYRSLTVLTLAAPQSPTELTLGRSINPSTVSQPLIDPLGYHLQVLPYQL